MNGTPPTDGLEGLPRVTQFHEDLSEHIAAWKEDNRKARGAIISACFSLIHELETPSEMITRMTWGSPAILAVLRTAIDLDLFQHCGDETKSAKELAEATHLDPSLMIRIVRSLAAVGIVRQVGQDAWAATSVSKALRERIFVEAIRFHVDLFLPVYPTLPGYLHQRNYQNPTDTSDTALANIHGLPQSKESTYQIFHRLGRLPELDSVLKVWALDRVHWSDEDNGFYPITQHLIDGARRAEEEVFLVDIGGGQGGDIANLVKLHSSIPGRLVLQELPDTISKIRGSISPNIQLMAHDFFAPQPIEKAGTYFMHCILHSWPPQDAKTILSRTAAAMEKGYSKLIIWDEMIPDDRCPPLFAGLDWVMLAAFAGRERTESEWKMLIESEDISPRLKVTGFWYYNKNDQGIVEAELA